IAKSSVYKKAISGGITIPDFKLYYRATVLKTAWYWHQNRHVDQWNRIEDPDINPHRYENLIFDKDAKTVKWKKESIFNKWCWHNWMATCRRLQIDPYLSPCTKLKSKWIKDLNINPVTLNLIEEKVGSTLERIGTGDHFLNITPTAQTLSATINQWDYMKLRSFCKAKDTITKTKHQPTEWEKIFTNPTSDRGLISRIYKELKKHDIKTPNSPIEKWAIELNREFTAEEYRMAERHLRKCSTSLLIREMQIKTTLRYHLTPVRMAKIKNTGTVHVGEHVEQEEHFSTVGGNADCYNHSGKHLVAPPIIPAWLLCFNKLIRVASLYSVQEDYSTTSAEISGTPYHIQLRFFNKLSGFHLFQLCELHKNSDNMEKQQKACNLMDTEQVSPELPLGQEKKKTGIKDFLDFNESECTAYTNFQKNNESSTKRKLLSKWLRSRTLITACVGVDVEQGEHFSTADGIANLYSHFGNQYGSFSENGIQSSSRPSYTTLEHIPKECSIIRQGHMLNYIHSSIIHNNQNLETT
ncbi:hypothetical protein STEG23_029405, partial [Scotinomys teguina]